MDVKALDAGDQTKVPVVWGCWAWSIKVDQADLGLAIIEDDG